MIPKLLNLALAVSLAPLALRADVIFSNLSGTTPNDGVIVSGGGSPKGSAAAEAFTPTANFSMTDAEVLLVGGEIDLYLYTNNSGEPGTEIEELETGLSGPSGAYALETASGFTAIDLTAGTEYWLVLKPVTALTDAAWGNNGSSSVPEDYSLNGGTSWSTPTTYDAQFEIDGTPLTSTPEPSELPVLLGAAAAGLLIAPRRKA